MDEESVTPLRYLREVLATIGKHAGELVAAVGGVVLLVLTALGIRSLLTPQPFGSGRLLFAFLLPLGAVLLFAPALGAWRLHRRQRIALATTRSLLDLNAEDRADLERHLRARYARSEVRIAARNAARLERLAEEIAALQIEIGGARRSTAM